MTLRFCSLIAVCSLTLVCPALHADDELTPQDNLIIESLLRLENYDYAQAKPRVKEAVGRYLKARWGTEESLDLIQRFKIQDHNPQLLESALARSSESIGVRSAKLLLESGQIGLFGEALKSEKPAPREAAMTVLGYSGMPPAVEVLTAIAVDAARSQPHRSFAVQSLAKSRAGETRLIELAQNEKLPEDLHVTAASALAISSDPAIREAAAKHLKTPAGSGGKPLPPISDLVQRTGDAANGQQVYMRSCIACHQVGTLGVDFGPKLTEIGDKLPKEGLYTAILDPNAGISFGYEGVILAMKDGAQTLGFASSETQDTLTLRIQGGISQSFEKSKIASRTILPTSLMPPGLQMTMSEQELVDLVEYLAGLKKPKN